MGPRVMDMLVLDEVFAPIGQDGRRRGSRAAAAGSLMAATRREVAVLGADLVGAHALVDIGQVPRPTWTTRKLFRDLIEDTAELFMVIDPRPGLHIVDLNEHYAGATLTNRRKVAGSKLFDTFPDNPEVSDADGVGNLFESLQRVTQSGRAHTMAVQRYDVQNATGKWVEKYWAPTNIPIFDEKGRLAFLLHHVRDVTPR